MDKKIWAEIGRELQPSHLLRSGSLMPAIISGFLIGLMTSVLSISFAVLVFGKAIPEAMAIGMGLALFSNIVFHLSAALTSSGEGIISHVQSLPPPIQAVMLSSIMTLVPVSIAMEQRTTVAALALMVSTMFTGAVLWIAGWLKLGQLVRFLPMPVIRGVLASVGFALILGGMATMTNTSMSLLSLPKLLSGALLLKWLPGLGLAVVLWNAAVRWKNALVFPALLALSLVFFYGICFIQGLDTTEMTDAHLLLGPFQHDRLWYPPWVYHDQIQSVDWSLFTSQIGITVTLPLVSLLGGLLMLSAIEFSTGIEVHPNYELKAMGAGNVLSGVLGGGFVGYPSATFTVMQHQLGASTRLTGMVSTLIPIFVLISGANFLGFIPRFIIGGLLIHFGYQFIDHWVIKLIRHASKSDNVIVGAIVVTSLWLGFVASVGVGVLAAASFFLFKYSKISVIRYRSTGAVMRSRVVRNAMYHDWLSVNAERIAVFGLHGYIFFGTAHNLLEEIMLRATDTSQPALDSVMLDFRQVTGIDTSVMQSFHRLFVQLRKKDIALVFAHISPDFRDLIKKSGSGKAEEQGYFEFDNLDAALEWREEYLLKNSDLPPYQSRELPAVFAENFKDQAKAETLMHYLERLALKPGTKIIQQNEVAHDLYFIESGRLSTYINLETGAPVRLETMVDDTMVGEIGFYLGQLRTATVMADAPSIVYCLRKEALTQMEREHPELAMALHRLIVEKTAQRLIHVSKTVKGFL